MTNRIHVSLTLYIEVHDPEQLKRAADAYVVEAGIDPDAWKGIRCGLEDDLRMLLDPGSIPDTGFNIVDSHCETTSRSWNEKDDFGIGIIGLLGSGTGE